MKITGPGAPKAPRAAGRVANAPRAGSAAAATAVDAISVAGIPEDELTPRVREALTALMREVADLRRELTDVRGRMVELELLASTDPLIGVLNRRAFVGELNRALGMAQRYSQPSSLVFIDLDDLKKINDKHGHAIGDAALMHAAEIISANIRQTDVFGRLGGDEFAIILTNTPRQLAEHKATLLAELVKGTPGPDGLSVSITYGVVEIAPGLTAEAALVAADKVMYDQKRKR
ncbi:MAG: GGDEF domain-containing protein [Pseudomonadota bacterium]